MDSPITPPLQIMAVRLTEERQRQGRSIADVARSAGIAKSTLSQLESAQGNPGIETLWSLCVALNIPFASLFETPKSRVTVLRRGEGIQVSAENAYYHAFLLSSASAVNRRDLYTITAQPGKDRISEPHMAQVTEHILLMTGSAVVGTLDEPATLLPGDYISYPGDVPHIFKALEPDTTAVMIIEH
ncbi:helix-turn-helix domain-containing protein [Morganella morganii]|uniref:helix-turn-helix domain-containing protein n=1 Tax=Morganella morganii TaxID=582 RepID=UPI001419BEBD|nr:XRE family transcriptional regulator [Morganella morganii]NIH18520.1 helix-turn-helix transcriptional regulator [Morganella morganii]QXO74387.1 helix-turn-helix transcriptional regulator [Morganella morganii]